MDFERKRQIVCNEIISSSKIRKIDFLLEQKLIKFFSVPSLESMAIIKIATGLCKPPDIRDAILKHSFEFDTGDKKRMIRGASCKESFEQVENDILKNLSLLSLPNLLKAKVSNVIRPIEYQIYEWIRFRKEIDFMDSIYWSNEGTIDVAKSFDQLINKDSANCSNDNFEMACGYCLEDYIPDLFNQLPEKIQNYYFSSEQTYNNYENHLIAYWTSTLKKDLNGLLSKIQSYDPNTLYNSGNSVYQNMFTLALSRGNIEAVKYFWNRLASSEISNNLVQWVNESLQKQKRNSTGKYQDINTHSNVTYFLLSQMDEVEQQKEIFHKNSYVILYSLLRDWPWQRFFMPTLHAVWFSVCEKIYHNLWAIMTSLQIDFFKATENLLREFWLDTPINLKKCFIQYTTQVSQVWICKLLLFEDLNTIKLILNHANIEEKRKIMFRIIGDFSIREIIFANKTSSLDILIQETLSTESDVYNFKEGVVLKHGNELCLSWILKNDWQMVELFFNWAFYSNEQRNEFKNERLDKLEILHSILNFKGDYKLADKFVNWCFSTDQEIGQFKKDFIKSQWNIVLGDKDWDLFEKFISWCFLSDKDIDEFKSHILQSCKLLNTVLFRSIVYKCNVKCIDRLINWCCHPSGEGNHFKETFVLSEAWMDLLQRFFNYYKEYRGDYDYNYWELVEKFIKLFYPLEKEVVIKLKEKIEGCINF